MHPNAKVCILFSAILIILICHLVSAQDLAPDSKHAGKCAKLDITITSEGKPVDKASVFVRTEEGDESKGRTNKEGVAFIKDVPYGITRVQVITESGTITGVDYELKKGSCSVKMEVKPKPATGGEQGQ
jgi:hypothetical protein